MQAVGGLELNVRDRIPIGGVGGPVTGYIEPGVQRLNGFETLVRPPRRAPTTTRGCVRSA